MTDGTLRRLLGIAAPFRWWMALSALLGFLTIASSIGLMSAAAWIIASAALHPAIGTLNVAIVGVRFFGITRGLLRYAERYVSHQTTFRLLSRLRVWFYQGIEPLAPARLTDRHSGDLLARAVADIDTLENFYLRVIAPPAVAVLVTLLMVVFLGATDLRLAMALVVCLALAGIGVPLMTSWLARGTGHCLVTTRSALTATLLDGVQGMADLTLSGALDRQRTRVADLSRDYAALNRRMARAAALNSALISVITSTAVLLTLVIAIPRVNSGQIEGVLLAVFVLATLSSFEAVAPLPAAFQHLGASLTAARRLFELVDTPPAVCDPLDSAPPPAITTPTSGSPLLVVRDLRFRYAPDLPPALDGISLALRPGETLAVVGSSGAGKSTLANVLLRFWDVEPGAITLAGYDLRAYSGDAARAWFSVVSQSTTLFNGTIRDNLLLARPGASETDLMQAAQRAQLHSFVQTLPQGYDTWIGEQGMRLSGGERQRIAIARAVLKDAPILILDEATANLDAITGRAVLDTVFSALADRATLLITHDMTGLERADRVLVLQAGRIVEQGTHADLLQIDGIYRRLWTLQHAALRDVESRI